MDQDQAAAVRTVPVSIWHNKFRNREGIPVRMLDGYQAGDPQECVFAYESGPGGPEQLAEEAFGIGNGHPDDDRGARLSERYYGLGLRSVSVGDVVVADGIPLSVDRAGWTRIGWSFKIVPA